MITTAQVHLDNAHKTPQFWLLWLILCLNVSAGIGIIGAASPMLQETFGGELVGQSALGYLDLKKDAVLLAKAAAVGAGFVGLISLFNIFGRIGWASSSDHFGRKTTYFIFFTLGAALYVLASFAADWKILALFVACICVIASMYGGGFATIPAYLADMFGTQFVGAIHGRLLTAWSAAGIIGPVVVNYLREFQLAAGVPRAKLYDSTMYILCSMLIAGFICNYLVKPVASKWYMSEADVAKLQAASAKTDAGVQHGSFGIGKGGLDAKAAAFWLFVGIPLAWGVYRTLLSAAKIF
jgi:MFS family permease